MFSGKPDTKHHSKADGFLNNNPISARWVSLIYPLFDINPSFLRVSLCGGFQGKQRGNFFFGGGLKTDSECFSKLQTLPGGFLLVSQNQMDHLF